MDLFNEVDLVDGFKGQSNLYDGDNFSCDVEAGTMTRMQLLAL